MVVISSQRNNSRNRLFAKGKHHSFGFALVSLLSILFMFSDFHYKYLSAVRYAFSVVVLPLQYTVDYPVRIFNGLQAMLSAKSSLINENIKLHYQQTMVEAELQRLMAIQEENTDLKALLLASSKAKMKAMAAEILAVDTSIDRQLLVLNKGKRDGVYVGQAVLDAKGVMGQIIDVGYMTSTILLISDAKSAVPVRNNRTGERGILTGMNNTGLLSLVNLPNTAAIAKDDLLVTSGFGGLYPEGYPVGRVVSVQSISGEAFMTIEVAPVARLNQNRLVLLIWPDKEQAKLNAQINERMHAVEALS